MIRLKSATISNPTKEGYKKTVTASASICFACDSEEEQEVVMARLQETWKEFGKAVSEALASAD